MVKMKKYLKYLFIISITLKISVKSKNINHTYGVYSITVKYVTTMKQNIRGKNLGYKVVSSLEWA